MMYRTDVSKRLHASKMIAYTNMNRLQKSKSEYAKKQFNRKPYQIGGKENECSRTE